MTTFETNVIGTLNVLEACRTCDSVKAVVNVTTDKCYENHEDGRPFKESDPLGGYDPYSASKACSEIVSSSYRRSFLQQDVTLRLATARAGNVIGGGDWAENRLLPDCIRSLAQHKSITIRQPQSIRPWQLVLEPLIGYLCLAAYLLEGKANIAPSYNFGPQPQEGLTVKQIAELAIEAWGSGEINIAHSPTFQEAKLLTLDISKATAELGVSPVLNAAQAVSWSVQWYRHFYQGPSTDMRTFSLQQIADFTARARTLGLSWAQD